MFQRLLAPFVLASVFFAGACTTPTQPGNALKPSAPAQKAAPGSADSKPVNPPLEYEVKIVSEPSGGIVVIDGVPQGKTPLRVTVAATSRGFCRDQISIKVRFVASDAQHVSHTVEEILTPLDKVPAVIHFTPTGAMRTAR
jgi:hypothetical protein